MFNITIQYSYKGQTPGNWIVNPDHFHEVSGESLVEALSKFNLALVKLQQDIHDEEMAALRGGEDDIPF